MPPYNPDFDLLRSEDILNNIKAESHRSAYKLCEYLNNEAEKGFKHKIATAESLTGGLIFSTLVDIPFYGYLKYGCFSVYDTDAKRVMLGVNVEDVYTRRCARQMAEGILRNSNATIGIAVSGNAMAINDERNRIGEVFIGVATYRNDKEIVSKTYAINTCNGTAYNQCKLWYETIEKQIELKKILVNKPWLVSGFNDFILTSFIASYIRAKTTHLAFIYALDFMKEVKKIERYDLSNLQAKIEISRIDKENPNSKYKYMANNIRVMPCQSSPLKLYNDSLLAECLDKKTCDSVRDVDNPHTTAEFKKQYMSDRHIENISTPSLLRSDSNLLTRSYSPRKNPGFVFPVDVTIAPQKPSGRKSAAPRKSVSPRKSGYRVKSAGGK
jgi:nicotinamide-nucleotide amidase